MGEIVVAVDVFQKGTVLQVSDTTCRTGGVQGTGHIIGLFIEIVIILGFVYSYTPYNDRRVVSILENHIPCVVYGSLLPFFVSYVLPSRNLSKYK